MRPGSPSAPTPVPLAAARQKLAAAQAALAARDSARALDQAQEALIDAQVAEAVRAALVGQGVDAGRQANRRVEIVLSDDQGRVAPR